MTDAPPTSAAAPSSVTRPRPGPVRARRLPRTVAAVLVLLLLVPYAAYFWVRLRGPDAALLGLAPGLIGIGLLLAAGFDVRELYLRIGRLSRRGLLVLIAVSPLLGVVIASGRWQGWDPGYAAESALSGVSQELYFRAAMFPALLWLLRGQLPLALTGQSLLSVMWHARMFTEVPVLAWPVFLAVLFTAMFAWGYITHHDRTVVWAMTEHCLFLLGMSLFAFG